MSGEPLIEGRGIGVSFAGAAVLEGVDIAVPAGGIVTVVGPNGAGKTTLIKVLLGLLRPQRGEVLRQPGLRIGYVPQRLPVEATLPLTVARFMSLALPGRVAEEQLAAALRDVGAAHVLDRQVRAVSGGELQRVLLARAMLRRPQLLVLDEPAGGVDVSGQAELYDRIALLRRETGCGVLMVSHDLHLVMAASDQVICLNRHVCCAGHPQAVSRDPAYAAMFGPAVAASFGIYEHHHDHRHCADGSISPVERRREAGHG